MIEKVELSMIYAQYLNIVTIWKVFWGGVDLWFKFMGHTQGFISGSASKNNS